MQLRYDWLKLVPPSVDKFRADLNFFIWTASIEMSNPEIILEIIWEKFTRHPEICSPQRHT